MAYDEALAGVLRDALAARGDLSERRMFGGLCFLINGNMLCGAYRDRGMFRVGKAGAAAALALPHVAEMAMGGRAMPGMVEAEAAAITDPAICGRLMALALEFVGPLPAK